MSRRRQLVRTLTILKLLTRPAGASMQELVDELQVTARTLQRDLAAIDEAGFRVLIDDSAWPPRKRVQGDALRFGRLEIPLQDLVATALAAERLSAMGSGDLRDALRSLLVRLAEAATPSVRRALESLHVLGPARSAADPGQEAAGTLAILATAVVESRVVRIDYASTTQRGRGIREVEPLAIVPRRSGVYLVGPEAGRHELRHYKLSRVAAVELTNRRFRRPAQFSVDDHFGDRFGVFGGVPVDVRIRFSSDVATHVQERRWHRSQQVHALPDGSVELCMRVAGLPEVRSWVQSFGAAATVLDPQSLADEIAREARLVAARHGGAIAPAGNRRPRAARRRA